MKSSVPLNGTSRWSVRSVFSPLKASSQTAHKAPVGF